MSADRKRFVGSACCGLLICGAEFFLVAAYLSSDVENLPLDVTPLIIGVALVVAAAAAAIAARSAASGSSATPAARAGLLATCVLLVTAAHLSSFLALLLTGEDSALAGASSWAYAPWLVALALTILAVAAVATAWRRAAGALIAGALLAYAATWVVWSQAVT